MCDIIGSFQYIRSAFTRKTYYHMYNRVNTYVYQSFYTIIVCIKRISPSYIISSIFVYSLQPKFYPYRLYRSKFG